MSDYDAVVIGSGFGGSISANRLAHAGKKVLVLERGPWRDTVPVRSMGIEQRAPLPYGMKMLTHLFRTLHFGKYSATLNKDGLFELFATRNLHVLAVSSVGGASIAWGGLLQPPVDPAYWQDRHPALAAESIEKYYPKVLADMGAIEFQRTLFQPQSVWDHIHGGPGQQCQPGSMHPRMALHLPKSASEAGQVTEFPGGIQRQASAFDGDSILGSRGGSKASVDFIYLAPVLNKGVTVRDLCEVARISRDSTAGGTGYTIHFIDHHTGNKELVRTPRVVLAAGTMNTIRLLFASTEVSDGLEPMPALGRTFGANGDLLGAWYRPQNSNSSFRGTPCLGAFTVAGHDDPLMAMGTMAGFDTLPMPAPLKRKLGKTYVIFGIGRDSGRASVSYTKGKLSIHYDQHQEPVFATTRSAFKVLERETGDATFTLKTPLTPHQWGGACIGENAEKGVVNHLGEVYGNPGLYLADGSCLPAAPGGPPSLAIAAWAHHVANNLALND